MGVPRFVASADALTIAGSGGGVAAVQPLPVTGSKFQYVRLVTTSGGGPVQQGERGGGGGGGDGQRGVDVFFILRLLIISPRPFLVD